MSNILASLSVRLLGDIGGFVESMDKAVKTADSAGSGIAGKLGGALATVARRPQVSPWPALRPSARP